MVDPRFTAAITGSLKTMMAEEYQSISDAARNAVTTVSMRARDRLREQVRNAGLGTGLEKAWQVKLYPRANRPTTSPAALVYSKAQKLHDAYNTGGIIRAKNGSQYLAIPTEFVPTNFSPRRKMTPVEVEAQFNQDLVFIPHKNGRPGGVLVLKNVVLGKNTKKARVRQATDRRLKQGREQVTTVMFVLIPSAHLKKVLDIDAVGTKANDELATELLGELNAT